MTLLDDINRALRDHERFTGDGKPNEPVGAPLPVGDPRSAVRNPDKKDFRTALLAVAQAMGDPDALDELKRVLDDKAPASAGMKDDERTKLGRVADGATKNDTDANLRDRSTHTGRQGIETVDKLPEALDTKAALADLDRTGLVQTERPGEDRSRWSTVLTGAPEERAALTLGEIANGDRGAVLRIRGEDVPQAVGYLHVGPRRAYALDPGRVYRVRAAFARAKDSADPSGDMIELRVQNLNLAKAHVSHVVRASVAPKVADGLIEVTLTLAATAGPGVDYVPPASTRYVVPFFRIYGVGQETDLVHLIWDDVTDSVAVAGDLAMEAEQRIAAIGEEAAARRQGQAALKQDITAADTARQTADALILEALAGEGRDLRADDAALRQALSEEVILREIAVASRVPLDRPWSETAQTAGVWHLVNTAYQAGKVYNAALGRLSDHTQYRAMYVPVTQGDILRFSGGVRGVSVALAAWVDEAGDVLGLVHPGTADEIVYEDVVAIAPIGSAGVWMTGELLARRFPQAERLISGGEQPSAPARLARDADLSLSQWQEVPVVWTNGGYISRQTGEITVASGYRHSKVAVTPGEGLRVSGDVAGTALPLWIWYDAAGRVIYSHGRGETAPVALRDVRVVVPVGAVQLGVTQIMTPAQPFTVQRQHRLDSVPDYVSDRLASELRQWVAVGLTPTARAYIRGGDGQIVADNGYSYDQIDVTGGEPMRVSADIFGGALALVVWFGAGGAYLGSYGAGANAAPVAYRDVEVTAPADAVQMGIAWRNQDADSVRVDRVDSAAPSISAFVETFVDGRIEAELSDWVAAEIISVPRAYIRGSDGSIVANSAYAHALLSVTSGDKVRVSGDLFGGVLALVVWYGADGVYLGSYGAGSNGAAVSYRGVELTAPPGAVRMGLSWRNQEAETVKLDRYAASPSIAAYVDKRLGEAVPRSYWTGKSIAWFGTSIPAGSATGGRYPEQIAAALGAEVHNMALSGSPIRAGYRSLVTEDDPYGFAGSNWSIITQGLSATLAEKQDIIDNWAQYRTLFKPSSNPPEVLSAAQKANILDSSYERRLVAANLGANRRDAYVFDHGFNDGGTLDDLTTGPANSRDRFTYRGAVNAMVDRILSDNPRASILFIGHYDASDPTRTTLIAAQQDVAAYWSRPLWRGWEALGWSSAVVVETNGYWSNDDTNGVWIPEGGSLQRLTMNRVWSPDGVHPARDISGASIRRVTDAMLPWWQSVAR